MEKRQWFVLAGIFILIAVWVMFSGYGKASDCVEETFSNFAKTYSSHLDYDKALGTNSFYEDYAYNEYNLIQCAVRVELYDLLVPVSWYLAIIFVILGLLEPKKEIKK